MNLTTAELLTRVHAVGAELVADGCTIRWRAQTHLPVDLLADLKNSKAELLGALRSSTPLDVYRDRINGASNWQDLYAILADADIAYVQGVVDGADIDQLCDLCRVASRRLPEHAPEEGR